MINDYQQEQLDALVMVRQGLASMDRAVRDQLMASIDGYRTFRQAVDQFLDRRFSGLCTRICYQSRTSACCSKDGIITFFADTAINALLATPEQLDRLQGVLNAPNSGHRCVYLGDEGCIWTLRPVVCAMFLCQRAMDQVFGEFPDARQAWQALRQQEKRFKWPDRPVLFDQLEQQFMQMGYRSTLMHLHLSPGLLRIKREAGLDGNRTPVA